MFLHPERSNVPASPRSTLTAPQARVLQAFEDLIAKRRVVPTVREVGAYVGMRSSSTVQTHINALRRLGHLITTAEGANRPRSLLPYEKLPSYQVEQVCKLPLVGQVAAGIPILAEENIEDDFEVPASFARRSTFMLKVKGDSMVEAGISDGDTIFVDPDGDVSDGRIIVALVSDEATVKRIFREPNDMIRLQPANVTMDPIYAHACDVSIVGSVGGLYHPL